MFGTPLLPTPHPPLAMCSAQLRALLTRTEWTASGGKPCEARKLLMPPTSAPSAPGITVAATGGGGGGGGGGAGGNVAGGRVTGGMVGGTVVGAAVVVVGRGRVVVVVDRGTGRVVGAGSGSITACLAAAAPQLVSTSNAIPANAARER